MNKFYVKIVLRKKKGKTFRFSNDSYYFAFFLLNIITTIIIANSIITAQIPAVVKSFGFAKAFVHIAIFRIKIARAYPEVPAPINAITALNHFGKTSVNKIAVIKQISAINTQMTKCIE